jgi:hypothetical protein
MLGFLSVEIKLMKASSFGISVQFRFELIKYCSTQTRMCRIVCIDQDAADRLDDVWMRFGYGVGLTLYVTHALRSYLQRSHSVPCSTLQQRLAAPSKLYQLELLVIIVHAREHHILPHHHRIPAILLSSFQIFTAV